MHFGWKFWFAVTFLAVAAAGRSGQADQIIVPPDDLPSARIGDCEIAFTRNGALAFCFDKKWLLDLGLNFACPGWKVWGAQIRRADPRDQWTYDLTKRDQIVFHGTLFDIDRKPQFRFDETSTLIDGGMRLSYVARRLGNIKVHEFGMVIHLGIDDAVGARVQFWPGFEQTAFPQKLQRAVLLGAAARAVAISLPNGPKVSIVASHPVNWRVLDDRAWQVNTFRIVSIDGKAKKELSESGQTTLSVDFLVPKATASPATWCNVDRYGRTTVLAAGGAKLLEGGVARCSSDGTVQTWLYGTSLNKEIRREDGKIRVASILPTSGKATYSVSLEKKGKDSCRIRYALSDYTVKSGEQVVAGFIAPVTNVLASPDVAQKKQATNEERFEATVCFRSGTILCLTSPSPWNVVKRKVGKTNCYALSVPLTAQEPGAFRTTVEVERSKNAARSEEQP